MKAYKIEIEGMGCMKCVASITAALQQIDAEVKTCEIGFAEVAFDGDTEELKTAVEDRGFDVIAITEI